MLERIEHDNGVVTFQSSLLRDAGVRHAFSTRRGGVSKEGYASLNLGSLKKGVGDANMHISENFRRLRAAVGLQKFMRYEVNQVHGCAIWDAPPKPLRPEAAPEADAIVTQLAQRMLTVRTADCVPVLFYDGTRIAAVHAGWRGIVAGVVTKTVAQLDAANTIAAIGPAIGVEHYEVGDEVADRFVEIGLASRVISKAKAHLDLGGAVRDQLEKSGVLPGKIDVFTGCTYRDEEDFFSYRRDVTHRGGRTGHMAAVIALD